VTQPLKIANSTHASGSLSAIAELELLVGGCYSSKNSTAAQQSNNNLLNDGSSSVGESTVSSGSTSDIGNLDSAADARSELCQETTSNSSIHHQVTTVTSSTKVILVTPPR